MNNAAAQIVNETPKQKSRKSIEKKREFNTGNERQGLGDTSPNSKTTIRSMADTCDDGTDSQSEVDYSDHAKNIVTANSPQNKRHPKPRHHCKNMHAKCSPDQVPESSIVTFRGKPRCQRSPHKTKSQYQEAINRLSSEIDRMASHMRSKVEKELTALENKERELVNSQGNSSNRLDETSSVVSMSSDTESATMSSGSIRWCGCMQLNKSPNQRSKSTSRMSYTSPCSLLRQPREKLFDATSSEGLVDRGFGNEGCDGSWYANLAKAKKTMDEKYGELRELLLKPIGDCEDVD